MVAFLLAQDGGKFQVSSSIEQTPYTEAKIYKTSQETSDALL
jgi:hypothetical protein